MGIPVAAIVIDVHHLEVAGKLLDDHVHLACQMRVTGVQTGAHLACGYLAKEIHHVAHMPKHEMGKHVLQQKTQPQIAATRGYSVQRYGRVMHALQKLSLVRTRLLLRPRVEHHLWAAHERRRLARAEHLLHRRLPHGLVQRGDVDPVGKRGVEGHGPHPEGMHAVRGAAHLVSVVKVEMLWKRAYLDLLEAMLTHRLQDVKNPSPIEAAGG